PCARLEPSRNDRFWGVWNGRQSRALDVFQLLFGHSEIVPEFVDDRAPDLLEYFGIAGADGLDIFLVEHDVVRACPQVKDTLLGHRYALEHPQAQQPRLARL